MYCASPIGIFGKYQHRAFTICAAVALVATGLFAGNAWADVLVGVAGPLTGPNAAFGAQLQKGAEQAAADINAAGGINGEMVRIVLGDDASDVEQGMSVANRFVADGVAFVIGHFNSSVSIPASEVYAQNGIMQITPASSNPNFTERGMWNTFRTTGRDDQQGVVAGGYIAENFKGANVAVIHDRTPYGQGLADETKKVMNAAGIQEVMYESIAPNETDYSKLITEMHKLGVSLVYFGGNDIEAGLIIRQMAQSGLGASFMSGDASVSNELSSIAGDAVVGTLMTFAPDPRTNPAAADVVEKFRAAGFEPEAYTLHSYAALQVIAEAAKAAGVNEPEAVAAAAKEKGPFKTVLGELRFDAKGDMARPDYVVYEWQKSGTYSSYSYCPPFCEKK